MPPNIRVQRNRMRASLPLAFAVLLAACRRESEPEPFPAQLRVESVSPAPTPAASLPRRTATPERSKYVPRPGDFTVVCTLFSGPPPDAKLILPDIPITYDAHIIVGAKVEAVTLGTSPWPPGTALRFLIHSPSLMLGGYGFSGRRFALTFSHFWPTTKDDLVWFDPSTRYLLRWLEVAPE